jgi:hypothetical protein
MNRPTEDELEDPAEIGYRGCLLPDGDAIPEGDQAEEEEAQ